MYIPIVPKNNIQSLNILKVVFPAALLTKLKTNKSQKENMMA